MTIKYYEKQIKLALKLSWVFSLISVTLAILPGISAILDDKLKATYNAELAILTVTLIGLIWYVYWTYRAVIVPTIENIRNKEEYKISLSTALLIEIQWIDRVLRRIYEGEKWSFDPISYPLLKEAERNLNIFSPNTISMISTFQNRILLFQESFKQQINGDLSESTNNKIKALLAIESLNELGEKLILEGGVKPKALGYTTFNQNNLPTLPSSIFPEIVNRHVTDVAKSPKL